MFLLSVDTMDNTWESLTLRTNNPKLAKHTTRGGREVGGGGGGKEGVEEEGEEEEQDMVNEEDVVDREWEEREGRSTVVAAVLC